MSLFSTLYTTSTSNTLPPTIRNSTSIITSSCISNSLLLGTFFSSPSILSLHQKHHLHRCCCAIKTGSHDSFGPDLLKKPVISTSNDEEEDDDNAENFERVDDYDTRSEEERWVDWEDQILEDTVPLVGFVRTILHSGRYQCGDRLSAEHESTILERLLPYHPEYDKKVGCGVDYILIGYHPQFQDSRCLFIVRKDGELVDFSYWKCIKGLIRKHYPLYADSFIMKHFRRRRRYE